MQVAAEQRAGEQGGALQTVRKRAEVVAAP